MPIQVLQIVQNTNIPLNVQASSLDEMTRQLPAGFYTTFTTLAVGTKVLGLKAHLGRLYGPARAARLKPAVDQNTLRERIAGLTQENAPRESRVRMILSKEDGAVYVGLQTFEPLPESIYEKGVHVITAEMARSDPQIKDSAFVTTSGLQRAQIRNDVFEVLMTKNGAILEGLTSNFYGIKRKIIITAARGILPGVTRKAVLQLAKGEGMSIEYRPPRVDEAFDEAFLTSSSRGVVPIVSIDRERVGEGRPGVWTKKLSKAYQAYVQERSEPLIK